MMLKIDAVALITGLGIIIIIITCVYPVPHLSNKLKRYLALV
jgi:hypothetical protein